MSHRHLATSSRLARPLTHATWLGLLVVCLAVVASCGTTQPTPPRPSGSVGVTATASQGQNVTPSPTETPPSATPLPSIYPVPTTAPESPAIGAHLDDLLASKLQNTIIGIRNRSSIPGLSVAVVFPDGTMWTGAVGQPVLGRGTQVTGDTLYAIGSITKTYTAAMALRLVERGTIRLEDPISKYLPSYPNGAKITVRQLLNHKSGIRDIFDPKPFRSLGANHSTRWTADKVLGIVGGPYFAPGTNYHYSTTNYIVLGQVIEKATGKTLASLVHSEFLTPLGLTHTYLQWQENPKGTLAHGYVKPASAPKDVSIGQTLIPFAAEATASGAGGGMASTAGDVARWATALYDGAFFDEATMASMTDVTETAPFKQSPLYGLGVEQLSIGGQFAIGHRGHLDGFWSTVAYYPSARITIAYLANADWINPLLGIASIYSAIPK